MGFWAWSGIVGLVAAIAVAMGTAIWLLSEAAPDVLRSLLLFCLTGASLAALLLAIAIFFSTGRNIDRG